MEIGRLRVVVRAKDFERTCRFYGEVMALPRLRSWEVNGGRGASFLAGMGVVEVRGRAADAPDDVRDEAYDYQGPNHKLTLTLEVPSAETAYEELLFRDKNIPGGLTTLADGSTAFETHDPDGVKILLREPEG